jgi:uncharacterized protein YeeX (DUF496 family)
LPTRVNKIPILQASIPLPTNSCAKRIAEQYQQIFEQAKNDYIQFYKDSGLKDFDIDKNRTSILHRAKKMSEAWYKDVKI